MQQEVKGIPMGYSEFIAFFLRTIADLEMISSERGSGEYRVTRAGPSRSPWQQFALVKNLIPRVLETDWSAL